MRFLPAFPVDANQPLDVEMARESLRVRATQSVHARTTMAVAVALAGSAFAFLVPWWRVLAWALPVVAMAQANAVLCRRILRDLDTADADRLARHQGVLWWITIANQSVMGVMVWWLGADHPGTPATIATTLQLVYVGGALVNASTHPPTFIAGAWINLSLAAAFWLTQGSLGWPLALALLGIGLIMAKSSQQTAASFRESLRMRFENADLLRKLAQEKLAAEEANAAKSRFLAAASHDLRQPLHALLVFSTLLHKRESAQTGELVGHIRSAAASLDKLFAGLLDLSKLETGGIAPQMQAVHVNGIAAELVLEYAEACRDKGITIAVEGADQWVLSDPFLLERVLRNLIDNAVKYTSSGGVLVRVQPGASLCTVDVVDTGTGIAPELQPRVFEEYFQVGNTARDLSKGSGLGLAIVRRLCLLLEAPLQLDSVPGRGSTFRLQLQAAPIFDAAGATSAVGEEGTAPDAPLAGLHVWLVEDHDLVRLATRRALEDLGATVSAWPGLPPAADRAPPPDALVADYRLAGETNGLQVAAALRRRWPSLPVAIVTGDPAIDKAAIDAMGRVIMLQKPVVPAVLGKWIHQQCTRRPARPAPDAGAQAILTP